jgi:uncharacterized membrane protein
MTFPEETNPYNDDEQPDNNQPASFSDDETAGQESSFVPEQMQPFPITGEDAPDFDFPRMEDDVAAFRQQLEERQFVSPQRAPEEEAVRPEPPSRRRRRTTRLVERLEASELDERFRSIVQRASPTFDFFVFSILCGCILGIGYILDAPAILLVGILIAPLLAPWVGVTLSAATGEVRFFGQTLGGLLTALGLVFTIGLLAGFASRIFQPLTSSQAFYHARLWWPDLLMLVIGTVILVIAFIQTDDKPVLASLMVAYQFYLPVSAAGFGLGSAVEGLWPEAGLVFIIHLALSLMVGLVVFYYMGFRPQAPSGYLFTAGIILAGLVIVAGFAGIGSLINVRGDMVSATATQATSTPAPTSAPSATPEITRPAPTATPLSSAVLAATPDFTPTISATAIPTGLTPIQTVTGGPTLLPTPVYGRVLSQSGGVMVREKPGVKSKPVGSVENDYLAEIQPDKPVTLDGVVWIHVMITTPIRIIDGWVQLSLIITATPSGSP